MTGGLSSTGILFTLSVLALSWGSSFELKCSMVVSYYVIYLLIKVFLYMQFMDVLSETMAISSST